LNSYLLYFKVYTMSNWFDALNSAFERDPDIDEVGFVVDDLVDAYNGEHDK
jgi:hypothetical protein